MAADRENSVAEVVIRPPATPELDVLRRIAEEGKRYWGYDSDLVDEWAALGDFSPEVFASKRVNVAEVNGVVVAWSSLIFRGEMCWLDDLWVAPPWIMKGIGARLFARAAREAVAAGATRMEWEAEPLAVGFYERMGGRYLRESEPSVLWGTDTSHYGSGPGSSMS